MTTGVLLPAWKRYTARFIQPEALKFLHNGTRAGFEKYIQSFGEILKNRHVLGNIDGYLSENGERSEPSYDLSTIDLAGGSVPSPKLLGLMKLDTAGRGKFHAMDEAFLQIDRTFGRGFYLHLKDTPAEPVVECIAATEEDGLLVHHDLIILEPDTHSTIVRIVDGAREGMVSDNVEIYAGRGSSADCITLNRSRKDTRYTAVHRAQVAEGARVNWYNVDLYDGNTAMSVRSTLAGNGAESRMVGVLIGKGDSQKDVSYETFHAAPDTVTSVLVRAAVLDTAKVVYRALTHIASGSRRAKVEQAEKSILLGEHARFDGIPSLWIDEDDVAASHSASSGMVDEQALFYLKSRGIPHHQAEKLITDGFIASLLNRTPLDLLQGLY